MELDILLRQVDDKNAIIQYRHTVLKETKKGTKLSGTPPELVDAANRAGEKVVVPPVQFVRQPGLGDRLFAVAAVHRYKQIHNEVDCWFEGKKGDTWLDWVPFIKHGVNEKAITVVNFDNVPANAGDRASYMASCIGVKLESIKFPIKVPGKVSPPIPSPYYVFVPFSSRRGPRSLPLDVVNEFTRRVKHSVALIDVLPCEVEGDHIFNMTSQVGLEEIFGLIRNSEGVISVDTGPLYIAELLDKPAVGLFTHVPPRDRVLCAEKMVGIDSPATCAPCGDLIGQSPPCHFRDPIPACIKYYSAEFLLYMLEEMVSLSG